MEPVTVSTAMFATYFHLDNVTTRKFNTTLELLLPRTTLWPEAEFSNAFHMIKFRRDGFNLVQDNEVHQVTSVRRANKILQTAETSCRVRHIPMQEYLRQGRTAHY